ncbi:MAG TPA: translocation/assembly module TamB domain-containing protein [Pararhizobium sp.]|nr:translocation/assembly module TamB domain-containing protein [Pararhizobium sp.]
MIRILLLILAFFAAPFLMGTAHAQADNDSEKSALTRFVENELSSENRRISLNNIQGALSSDATIGEITVADRQGVWLRIVNAHIVWTRSALLFGRLTIDSLGADKIELLRRPLPPKGAPAPSSSGFSLPKLPLSVTVKKLSVPEVDFGAGVFGLKSKISLNGALKLADGVFDTNLSVKRLDGPGGSLQLAANYSDSTKVLDLDLQVHEPKDGILANLLNIAGRPAVSFTLAGKGPISNLALNMTLDADGKRALTGKLTLNETDAGRAVAVDVHGPLANLVAPAFRGFFGGNSVLTAKAVLKNGGGVKLDSLKLEGGALNLTASAETTSDHFLKSLSVDARIANANGEGVLLPVSGRKTMVKSADLTVDFGNSGSNRWNGGLTINRLGTSTFGADLLKVSFGGDATGLNDPKNRHITFDVSGAMTGISTKNPDVKTALGDRVALAAKGGWSSGQPISIASASITANELALTLAGTLKSFVFDGTLGIKAVSLAPFAALANRPLSGSIDVKAKGTVKPLTGAFDLTFDGGAHDLATGNPHLDPLLAGAVTISGGLARTPVGFEAHGFSIASDHVSIKANGVYAADKANFNLDVMLADLGLVTNRASGRMTLSGTIIGTDQSMALRFDAAIPAGELVGRKLTAARIAFDGNLLGIDAKLGRPYGNGISGQITGSASLAGAAVSLQSGILLTPDEKKLSGLDFQAGATVLTGTVDRNAAGFIGGTIKLATSDISTAAALAMLQAKGAAHASIDFSHESDLQKVALKGTLNGIELSSVRIGSAAVDATVDDLFGVPKIEGHMSAANVSAGGIDLKTASVTATRSGKSTTFEAAAALQNGTDVHAHGSLVDIAGGYRVALDRFDLKQGKTEAHLLQPASVEIARKTIRIGKPIRLDVAGGHVAVSGMAGENFDLAVTIEKLPLSIANTIKPDLHAGGTISGTAKVTGSRAKPVVNFDVSARGITARLIEAAGLPAFDIDAKGETRGKRLDIDAKLSAGNGVSITAKGAVPLGGGKIDLSVDIARFPLAMLKGIAKGQNPAGTLTGKATVSGPLKMPIVAFSASGTGISAAPLDRFGVAPLSVETAGRYQAKTVTLTSLKISNAQGLSVTGRGTVPLSGGGLDVRAQGTAPLSIANRALAARGTRMDGTVRFSLAVGGTLRNPSISGSVSTSNANVIDPEANVRFNNVAVSAEIRNNRVTISRFNAPLSTGGSISAGGSFSLDAAAGFPANLTINLNQTRYTNGDFLTVTASGKLTVTGGLLRDPLVSGRIAIARMDIGIPSSLGGGAKLTDVRHIHTPADVEATLNRARVKAGGVPAPTARPNLVHLDIVIDAPRRIFVRGRGLDAEMGGHLRVRGPISSVSAIGGFDLIRGRLSILGKRIDFDSGTVTLTGSLDPMVNLVAHNQTDDTTITITVTGRASDPKIVFSSQPALPQDEVLAQLIFGHSISNLSGFQIAQLAAAVAELSGGANTSLLGNLRQATGLDDLDVTTDSNGNASVRAGRYIRDNVYLGVQAGANGSSQVDINLDITRSLKAKASAGTDDNSSVGLFFEKDY